MRVVTKKIGQFLYRDGAALVASTLFAAVFIQNIGSVTS